MRTLNSFRIIMERLMCFGGMFELYVQFQIFETWKLGISKSFLSHPNPYISVTLHFQFINKFYWLYLLKSFRFPPFHCIHSVAKSYHLSPERVIWSPCFRTCLQQCFLQTEAVWFFFFFFFKSRWYLKATKVLHKLIFCLSAPSLVSVSSHLSCSSHTGKWVPYRQEGFQFGSLLYLQPQEIHLVHSSCSINSDWMNESLNNISNHSFWINSVFRNKKLSVFLKFLLI